MKYLNSHVSELRRVAGFLAMFVLATASGSINATVMAITDTTAPLTPSITTISVDSSSRVTVNWNPTTDVGGSGVAGYLVYRGGVLVGPTMGTTYTNGGLAPGTQYCYTIVAYDNAGNDSPASAPMCVVTSSTDTTAPVTPSITTISVDSSSRVTVNWNPTTDVGGSGVAGYLVYRGGVLVGPTMGTTYTNGGLAPGTQYCYTIVAYDNAGNDSPASAPRSEE